MEHGTKLRAFATESISDAGVQLIVNFANR